jgi:hypothetical protein
VDGGDGGDDRMVRPPNGGGGSKCPRSNSGPTAVSFGVNCEWSLIDVDRVLCSQERVGHIVNVVESEMFGAVTVVSEGAIV